jgi:hypothetical protein
LRTVQPGIVSEQIGSRALELDDDLSKHGRGVFGDYSATIAYYGAG